MTSTDLWAVHVIGPDDLLAAPDHDTARSLAKRLRTYFESWPVDEYRPTMNAIVVVWPHSAESHAEEVARLTADGTWPQTAREEPTYAPGIPFEWGAAASAQIASIAAREGPMSNAAIDAAFIERQRQWSLATFGPGARANAHVGHIRKELAEIEAEPGDVSEWADVVLLALSGAWRAGHEPQAVLDAILAKQERNESRTWPNWRDAAPDAVIEHDRTVAAREGR